jgi:Domain of unknown function (DUF5010)/Carbohydrate binding module (family 35)
MKKKLALSAALAGVGAFIVALALGAGSSIAGPPTTYLDETFQDHANNWNVASGTWQIEDVGGGEMKYSNCVPAPPPPPGMPGGGGSSLQPTDIIPVPVPDCNAAARAWVGVASNSSSYTIDVDIGIAGQAAICSALFTNANNDDLWRVELSPVDGKLRIKAPAGSQNETVYNPTAAITSGAVYHLTITVTRTTVDVKYNKSGQPVETVPTQAVGISPDGKVGVSANGGDCDFDNYKVTGVEGIGDGIANLIPVFGYERTEACNEGPANPNKPGEEMTELQCDRPVFAPWNRDDNTWWAEMIRQMDYAGISIVAAHNRGCWTASASEMHGFGDMCPNQLTHLVSAIRNADSPLKIAMFDDLPTVGDEYFQDTGQAFDFGIADPIHDEYLWDRRWKLFYDTIPDDLRAKVSGRPLIFIWDPGDPAHVVTDTGRLTGALQYLRNQVQQKTGSNPFIVVSLGFWSADQPALAGTVTVNNQQVLAVDAVYSWWAGIVGVGTRDPAGPQNGYTGATIVPGFRGWPEQTGPGCGPANPPAGCREVSRERGHSLIRALQKHIATNFVLLEGWTNVIESAGWYPNYEGNDPTGSTLAGPENTLDYPNQTLNIVKRYAAPTSLPVVLEAETADEYYDTTPGNSHQWGSFFDNAFHPYRWDDPTNPGAYNSLDVALQDNTFYRFYVTDIAPTEWLRWRDIYLPGGFYSVTLTYASTSGANVCVRVNSADSGCVNLAPTGGPETWTTTIIDTLPLHKGLSNVRVDFVSGDVNLDKVIVQPAT